MCNSCNSSFVQYGNIKAVVHEFGCPDSWMDKKHECKYCGCEFQPEESDQEFCSHSCACAWFGYDDEYDEIYRETDYSGEDNDGFLLEETEEDEENRLHFEKLEDERESWQKSIK